jgi:hypothetical protein
MLNTEIIITLQSVKISLHEQENKTAFELIDQLIDKALQEEIKKAESYT